MDIFRWQKSADRVNRGSARRAWGRARGRRRVVPFLELEKPGLSEIAQRHDAPPDCHRGGRREVLGGERPEAGLHLLRRVVRTEIVRVGIDAPLPKRVELPPSDHDLLVVVGHREGLKVQPLY